MATTRVSGGQAQFLVLRVAYMMTSAAAPSLSGQALPA